MIGIIADDLTGAMDAAAPFAARGLTVDLYLGSDAVPQASPRRPDVMAVSVECRHLPSTLAHDLVAEAKHRLIGCRQLFLKIDSTLRGPIPAMIRAAADVDQEVVICPAVPAQHRRVRNGKLLVDDIPLEASELMHDPRTRPFAGDLVSVLSPLAASMPDADGQDDIAAILKDASHGTLLVGAAGLAQALATSTAGVAARPWLSPVRSKNALFVVGSLHPRSRAQLRLLRRLRPEQTVIATSEDRTHAVLAEQQLAHEAARAVDRRQPDTVFVTGGDSARALLDELLVQHLRVLGCPIHGLCAAEIVISGRPVLLITKSGGFGPDNILVDLCVELGLSA